MDIMESTNVFAEASAGEEARDCDLLIVPGQGGAADSGHAVGASALGTLARKHLQRTKGS